MKKMILLNGGKGAGKTDISNYLNELWLLPDARCKDHLYVLTQKFFNISPEEFFEIYEDRELKETPMDRFAVTWKSYNKICSVIPNFTRAMNDDQMYPLSIREAMIYVSEIVCKPTFGRDYFGRIRVESMTVDGTYIDDSAGFWEELPPLIKEIGQENIILLRIKGRGDFTGDSRSFIPDGVIDNTVDIENDEDLYGLFLRAEEAVKDFIEE